MTMVKIDENLRKHQLCMVENESHAAGIVKRRRRSLDELQIKDPCQQVHANSFASTGVKRSSRFRGVSRHKLTGRYEAHLWDRLSWNITQRRKGKQVYLGAYDKEELAARAYDLAALKYWGTTTQTNFPVSDYKDEIEIMESLTKEEYLATLRRKSSGFARGVSKYRGVARHHQNGRWEARIGRVFGNKYLYLGTYGSQEEAARAYDIAAVEYRGINAVTNFDLSDYIRWLKPGAESLVLPQQQERSAESQHKTFSSNFIKESESSILPNKTYDNLNREEYQTNNRAGSFRRSSSSTALSLLLRSSRFKELVEKNSSVGDDGTDADEDEKDLFTASDDYEDRRILHGGIGRIPYVFEFDDDCLELKKDLLTTLRRELLAE